MQGLIDSIRAMKQAITQGFIVKGASNMARNKVHSSLKALNRLNTQELRQLAQAHSVKEADTMNRAQLIHQLSTRGISAPTARGAGNGNKSIHIDDYPKATKAVRSGLRQTLDKFVNDYEQRTLNYALIENGATIDNVLLTINPHDDNGFIFVIQHGDETSEAHDMKQARDTLFRTMGLRD